MSNLTALTNKHRVIHMMDPHTQAWSCETPVKPSGLFCVQQNILERLFLMWVCHLPQDSGWEARIPHKAVRHWHGVTVPIEETLRKHLPGRKEGGGDMIPWDKWVPRKEAPLSGSHQLILFIMSKEGGKQPQNPWYFSQRQRQLLLLSAPVCARKSMAGWAGKPS